VVATWCSSGDAVAQPAAADSVALVVRDASPDGCFAAGALQKRIAHYIGTRGAQADELRFELQVDGQTSAELRVFRGDESVSRRRFEQLPTSCTERRDTIALSIALALEGEKQTPAPAPANDATVIAPVAPATVGGVSGRDAAPSAAPESRVDESAPEREPPSEREPDDTAVESTPATSEEESPAAVSDAPPQAGQDSGWVVQPHVGARWLAGALSEPVLTGNLGVELAVSPKLAFDLAAFVSTVADSEFLGGHAETWLAGGELFGCTGWKLGSFAAQGCLGAMAAACSARGVGYPVDLPAETLLWAAGAARAGLRWPDERMISLRLLLQAQVNLVRPVLHVAGSTEELAPGWVGGALGIDVILASE